MASLAGVIVLMLYQISRRASGISAQIVVQSFEIIERGVEGGQRLDELASFGMRVQLFGERLVRDGSGVVLFVFMGEEAHGLLEARAIQHFAFENVAFKGFQELEGAAHADAEGIDAALETLEVATLEDTD